MLSIMATMVDLPLMLVGKISKMKNLLENILSQAKAELPEIDSSNLTQRQWKDELDNMASTYINQMTNMELLGLIDRALS